MPGGSSRLWFPSRALPRRTFLVGAERAHEPLTFRIRKDQSLALEIDWAHAQRAWEHVRSVLGESSPARFALAGEGRVEFKLERHGDADFSWAVSLLSDLRVQVTDERGIVRSLQSAGRQPLAQVRVEGPARKVTSRLDLGPTEYRGLWADFFGALDTPMVVSWAGLTWNVVAQDGQPTRVTGLGFGDRTSTLSYGGETVFSLDWNEEHWRKVDVEITTSNNRMPVFKVQPELKARLKFALAPVRNAGQTIADELLSSRYTYALEAAAGQPPTFELIGRRPGLNGGFKLLSGRISLAVDDPSRPARAYSAGTCLTLGRSGENQDAMLDLFTSQSCPR